MYPFFTSFLTSYSNFKPVVITENSKASFYTVKGLNGLDSVDPFSLRIIWLLKISKSSLVKIEHFKYSIPSTLPILYTDGKRLDHPELILRRIDTVTKNIVDECDEPVELSKLEAFKAHCKTYLDNAVFLNAWGSEENMIFSLKHYSKGIPPPFKFFFIRRLRKAMTKKVEDLCKDDDVATVIERTYANTLTELQELSKFLEKSKYIFRDKPTTLDIYICSYLAPVLYLPYPDSRLMNDIKLAGHGIFEKYIKDFVKTYGIPESEHLQVVEEEDSSVLMLITAGIIALAAMTGYAFHKGFTIIWKRHFW